ncbi:hydrogenase iron-sulfur subunit [candidate division WOR-3 bacterium]|nr:hydrogenase iron-sulfur subunit [candidate division WOR-3 bacterium]
MKEEFTPKIVGFLCNWCTYAAADLAGTSKLKMPPSLAVVRVMCSSRVDPVQVLTALLRGADGVLVAGCHPGDCHYENGNYYARRRFALLKEVVKTFGLDSDRLQLAWISASEGTRFQEVVIKFTEKIKKMGPNPMKKMTSM